MTLPTLHFLGMTSPLARPLPASQGISHNASSSFDLRPESETYGKWEGVILTEENKKMFMIPKGFAHGFLVLSDEAEFSYKCDDIYNHEAEGGLAWNDEDIGIDWPMGNLKVKDLLTSEKDGKWPTLNELKKTDLFSNLKK